MHLLHLKLGHELPRHIPWKRRCFGGQSHSTAEPGRHEWTCRTWKVFLVHCTFLPLDSIEEKGKVLIFSSLYYSQMLAFICFP